MRRVYLYLMVAFVCTMFSASTCQEMEESLYVMVKNDSDEGIAMYTYISYVKDSDFITPGFALTELAKFQERIAPGKGLETRMPLVTSVYTACYQFLIFKQSTLDKYTKEELIEKNIFDKRYTLTYEELEKMNFKIVYTGE